MNKSNFIEKVAQETGLSIKETGRVLASLTGVVTKALKRGEKVVLTGFGTFLISKRAKRKGRNPQTGESITIKASRVPRFRPGKEFKNILK